MTPSSPSSITVQCCWGVVIQLHQCSGWPCESRTQKESNTWKTVNEYQTISRKLAVASWSYSCFSKGRGRPESTVIFHSNPPSPQSSRGILKRCWKQMVTGSNPAKSLGNLYSYQNPIKSISNQNSKSHHVSRLIWTLAFVHPLLGPQVKQNQNAITSRTQAPKGIKKHQTKRLEKHQKALKRIKTH